MKNIKSSYQNISNRLKILLTFIAICNISFCQGDTVSIHFRFYHSDHLGSASWITDGVGTPIQHLQYMPYGEPFVNEKTTSYEERFTFTGKERDSETGFSYFGARYYDSDLMTGWLSVDPMADKYPSLSPYAYCANNPVRLVDPDGEETHVAQNEDGTYRIIGGILNSDKNIYLYKQDENGEYTIKGNSIGITTSTTSFYNADANEGKGAWAIGSIINPNDESGYKFLNHIFNNTPAMFDDYMVNAIDGRKYDFKVTNGTDNVIEGIDIYRGMPIGKTTKGETIFSSGRDIGNIAAGYVAGANGMNWTFSRIAFDIFQSIKNEKPSIESLSSRNAEYYGWRIGSNIINNTPTQKATNLLNSFKELLKW